MVGLGASVQRFIREGFPKEVTFDLRPEDEKETHVQIVPGMGIILHCFMQKP